MEMNKDVKAIFFDADGTLYDLKLKECYDKMFEEISKRSDVAKDLVEKVFYEELEKVKKINEPQKRKREYLMEIVFEKLRIKEDVSYFLNIFWDCVLKNLKKKEGLDEFLKECKNREIILGIFSEEFEQWLIKKIEKITDKNIFSYFITPEITGSMKPSEFFYEKILEFTGFNPKEIMVVGDSWEKDLKLAKNYGMFTVLISEKPEGNPDIIVKNYKELFSYLFGREK